LWGALGLTRAAQAVPHEVFRQIAAWPDCRITLARELETLERPDLFPNDFMNQPSRAEATMVDWLLFPTELGRAPDEIRQLQVTPIETDDGLTDLYVFAFRTHAPHWLSEKDWVVGVAGPFLTDNQPTFRASVVRSADSRACQRSLSTSTSRPFSELWKAFPERRADPCPSGARFACRTSEVSTESLSQGYTRWRIGPSTQLVDNRVRTRADQHARPDAHHS
jgi:hypothetical protein